MDGSTKAASDHLRVGGGENEQPKFKKSELFFV